MSVDADITRHHVRQELAAVRDLAATHKWGVIPDYSRLAVLVTMYSLAGDLFIVEILCDDYKQLPPSLEFLDPETGERGTRRAYPRSADSFFHESGPCICAPFNRKAYREVVRTGPHDDWKLGDWQTCTANGIHWANYSKLGDILGLIQTRISRPDLYRGRMA